MEPLGALALGTMAVGVDLVDRKVALWPDGKLDAKAAEAWVGAAPSLGVAPRIRRIPLKRLPGGAYAVEAVIAGSNTPLLLRLGLFASTLEPTANAPTIPIGNDGFSMLPSLAIGDREVGPAVYAPIPTGATDRAAIGTPGSLTLDALAARRVIADFAAGQLYVEELREEDRLSLFLERQTRFPLAVSGSRIVLDPQPGASPFPALEPYYGSEIYEIAGEPASEWLKDLRGRDEASGRRLAERIAGTRTGFNVRVRKPDGSSASLNLRLPGR